MKVWKYNMLGFLWHWTIFLVLTSNIREATAIEEDKHASLKALIHNIINSRIGHYLHLQSQNLTGSDISNKTINDGHFKNLTISPRFLEEASLQFERHLENATVAKSSEIKDQKSRDSKKPKTIAAELDQVLDKEFGHDGEKKLEKAANEGRGTFNDKVAKGDQLSVVVRVPDENSNSTSIASTLLGMLPFGIRNKILGNENETGKNGVESNEKGDTLRLIDENNDEFVVSRPHNGSFELQNDMNLVRDLMFLSLSTICFGFLAYLLGQPPISGFLIGGSIVGPGGLGLINELVQVDTVAQLGVISLLMALGMEFKFSKIKGFRSVALAGGALEIILIIIVCGMMASLVSGSLNKGVFVGAMISMSSTTVVLQCITERGQMQSTFGMISIGTLILQDVGVGIIFAMLPILSTKESTVALGALRTLAQILTMMMTFFVGCWVFTNTMLPWLLAIVTSPGPSSVGLQHAFAFTFGMLVSILSDYMGLSLELGAFAAGVMISQTEHCTSILHAVEPLKHVFTTLFLGTVGMIISFKFIFQHILLLVMTVFLVTMLKAFIVSAVIKAFGYPLRTAICVGAAMGQIGEFAFVLLGRARELDIIEGPLYLLLLGSTALSLLTTPIVFKYFVWPVVGKHDCISDFDGGCLSFLFGRKAFKVTNSPSRRRSDIELVSDHSDDDRLL